MLPHAAVLCLLNSSAGRACSSQWGFFDALSNPLLNRMDTSQGSLSALNYRPRTPEQYDTRGQGKKTDKRQTIDPKNPATW
jgi:hypothetical protein